MIVKIPRFPAGVLGHVGFGSTEGVVWSRARERRNNGGD